MWTNGKKFVMLNGEEYLVRNKVIFVHRVWAFDGGKNTGHDFNLIPANPLNSIIYLLRIRWVPTMKGTYLILTILGLRLKLWRRENR